MVHLKMSLQQAISQQPEKCIISPDASDITVTLAGIYDTFWSYGINRIYRSEIREVFSFDTMFAYYGVAKGERSLMEEVHKGAASIDLASKGEKANSLLLDITLSLKDIAPEGYSFKTEGNEMGWFADLEPVTLQHVRTWMHNQVPSKRYNHASPKDALYLLDTLYAWKGAGIPIPWPYVECLQIIVDSHKAGDGL